MKLRYALVVAGALLAACGDTTTPVTTDDQGQAAKEIIGGFDAKSPSLNAIGTIGALDDSGNYSFFCSATLIGPKLVLTAKHCAIVTDSSSPLYKMKLVNLIPIFFAVGADANNPAKVYEAIAADTSPVEEGGFVSLGNDVAVYHLAEAVEGVTPIKVGSALNEKNLNAKYVSIGYGSKDNYEDLSGILSATRSAGQNTLRALEGKSFQLMESWDAFYKQMVAIYGKDIVDAYIDIVRGWYDNTEVLKGYEAWVGYSAGDVQTCHGDSGGPLIGREGGQKAIYGVVSGGWFSSQLTCDFGTFYATIGTETRTMLDTASKYVDPCVGITVQGGCKGDVATRCTGKWEGDRRMSEIDCSLLDQTCAVGTDGKAACVNAADPTSSNPTTVVGKAPSIGEIRKNVFNISRIQRRWAASQK